jgi:hypothetical protein
MQVNQTLTFNDQNFEVVCKVPTLKDCQEFSDYWRRFYAESAKIDKENIIDLVLASLPDYDNLVKRIVILRPYIEKLTFHGEEIFIDDISLIGGDLAQFLAAVSCQLYAETFSVSVIKKK